MAQRGIEHMIAPASVDLQITLRHTLILEPRAFQHPARGRVLGQARRFDPAQVQRGEGMVHQRPDRLAHVALPGKGRADPVAQRSRLCRAATDVVQRDRAQQHLILVPDDERRDRVALRHRATGPANPCGEGAPRQVILGPGRLPRGQEIGAFGAQRAPGAEIRMLREAQIKPVGLDPQHTPESQHQAASRRLSANRSGAAPTGP